ncbi:hypothetical protein EYF80_055188 [Liparis tanakae]|uniref:G-protein coupled receptors family 1 profile domain-containing protein n=1 Tax=Liparis tanakae TaxID=230148 RepID=A0A4Z2F0I4_9TELE|nr:hypothetical protein EYF80_055188 [Liparis tanakae]
MPRVGEFGDAGGRRLPTNTRIRPPHSADMSANSSSSSNSSNSFDCHRSTVGISINVAFFATRAALLLPASVLVLYLGLHRSSATKSDSDVFLYHMAAAELIWFFASVSFYCGFFNDVPEMASLGIWLLSVTYLTQGLLHVLACVERYLAVVHPVTYLGLRKGPGIRIRNISIGCAWLFCSGFSVLRVLIRLGPGEVGGNKVRVDPSKKRACHTVMAITGVLWFWFFGLLVGATLNLQALSPEAGCAIRSVVAGFNLPSSLVLPVMFLRRRGGRACLNHHPGRDHR